MQGRAAFMVLRCYLPGFGKGNGTARVFESLSTHHPSPPELRMSRAWRQQRGMLGWLAHCSGMSSMRINFTGD